MDYLQIFHSMDCFSETIKIPITKCKAAFNHVVDVFGMEFFSNPVMAKMELETHEVPKHSLLRLLYSNQALGIALGCSELLDLSQYLSEMKNVKNLPLVIELLKNAKQYKAALFQLSVASDLYHRGYTIQEMEPDTVHGKADVWVQRKGRNVLCECYRMNLGFNDKGMPVTFQLFIQRIFSSFDPSATHVIEVWTEEFPDEKNIRKAMRWFIRVIGGERRIAGQIAYESEKFKMNIANITEIHPDPHLEKQGDRFYFKEDVCANMDKGLVDAFARNEDPIRSLGKPVYQNDYPNRCIIHGMNAADIAVVIFERMKKTIDKKIKQAKVVDAKSKRAMFVEIPFGMYSDIHRDLRLKDIARDLGRKHRGMHSFVVSTKRLEMLSGRYKYDRILFGY